VKHTTLQMLQVLLLACTHQGTAAESDSLAHIAPNMSGPVLQAVLQAAAKHPQ
jgi:hypothetical protein